MIYKSLFLILFLLLSINTISATQIDIYYPNNNITTNIYYSIDNDYINIQNNTLDGNISSLIIKNQYESIDIISNPVKILDYTTVLLYIIIFGGIISMLIYVGIRVVKRI